MSISEHPINLDGPSTRILVLEFLVFLIIGRKSPKTYKKIITIDTIIMRFIDIMLCFPTFFLILTVVALLPPSIYNIMIVIGLTSWMGTARFVRAEFLTLRELDYVTAARSQAIPEWRIIFI